MKIVTKYVDIDSGRLEREIAKVADCYEKLESSDMAGWLGYASSGAAKFDLSFISRTAEIIRHTSEVFIVVGIGGSYLGSKAVVDALLSSVFKHNKDAGCVKNTENVEKCVEVIYAGQNLSAEYLEQILEIVRTKECCVNIVSKTGSTVESSIAARLIIDEMMWKYGDEYKTRVYVTTDKAEGPLRRAADIEWYTSFEIPQNIGGRFSVFTPAGLLPIAVAGVDIRAFYEGAVEAERLYRNGDSANDAILYAALRNYLDVEGKDIELFAVYEPRHSTLASWWVQLFGESCGKDGVGLFPAQACYTTDLHSIGQLVQEGRRNLFETVLWCEQDADIEIPWLSGWKLRAHGGEDFLGGKKLSEIARAAYIGTMEAHTEGGVPCIGIELEKNDAKNIGKLMYFFMIAAALSALSQGLNPFDQPGVEAYKKGMRKLLS